MHPGPQDLVVEWMGRSVFSRDGLARGLPSRLFEPKFSDHDRRTAFSVLMCLAPLCESCGTRKVKPKGIFTENDLKVKPIRRWNKRCEHCFSPCPDLSEEQVSAIVGTVLGDFSLDLAHGKARNLRLRGNHCAEQEQWIRHKAEFLDCLCPKITPIINRGYGAGKPAFFFCSKSVPSLKKAYDLVYVDGEKRITKAALEAIGEIGLAWWIADDGTSSGGGSLLICTNCFCKSDVELACDHFSKKYGPCSPKKSGRDEWLVQFEAAARSSVYDILREHTPKSMQYKLEGCRKSRAIRNKRGFRHRS